MNDFNVFLYRFGEEDIEFVRNNLLPGMKMEVVNDISAFIGEYYFLGLINQENDDEDCYSVIENYLNECNQTTETLVLIGKLKVVPKGNATKYIKIVHSMDDVKQNWQQILELAKENYYKNRE